MFFLDPFIFQNQLISGGRQHQTFLDLTIDSPDLPSAPADIVDGNLKTVMRIILALAAHFKPSANHRAAPGKGAALTRGSANHNPLSPVALAQGAAATLASARLDASQPVRSPRLYRHVVNTRGSSSMPSGGQTVWWMIPADCLPPVAGTQTWRRVFLSAHLLSSTRDDRRRSPSAFTPAGKEQVLATDELC